MDIRSLFLVILAPGFKNILSVVQYLFSFLIIYILPTPSPPYIIMTSTFSQPVLFTFHISFFYSFCINEYVNFFLCKTIIWESDILHPHDVLQISQSAPEPLKIFVYCGTTHAERPIEAVHRFDCRISHVCAKIIFTATTFTINSSVQMEILIKMFIWSCKYHYCTIRVYDRNLVVINGRLCLYPENDFEIIHHYNSWHVIVKCFSGNLVNNYYVLLYCIQHSFQNHYF